MVEITDVYVSFGLYTKNSDTLAGFKVLITKNMIDHVIYHKNDTYEVRVYRRIYDWLTEYCRDKWRMGLLISDMSKFNKMKRSRSFEALQIHGLCFVFDNADEAMLFKMSW